MRRAILAGLAVAVLLVGGVVLYPKHRTHQSAKSLLASVAEAMENASSVHMSGFGTVGDTGIPDPDEDG